MLICQDKFHFIKKIYKIFDLLLLLNLRKISSNSFVVCIGSHYDIIYLFRLFIIIILFLLYLLMLLLYCCHCWSTFLSNHQI